jgi:hypothetical protein
VKPEAWAALALVALFFLHVSCPACQERWAAMNF